MGIHNFELYKCYEINNTCVKEKKLLDNKNESREEETKGIYWLGNEKWQGLPVFSNMFYNGGIDTEAPLQILETSQGIE